MILEQGTRLLLLMLMLLASIAGCAPAPTPAPVPTPAPLPIEAPPAKEEGELKRVVEVEANGLILRYLRQSLWGEVKFSYYLAHQAEFKVDFKKHFEERLAKDHVSASGYTFAFDSTAKSIVVRCDIHDAISGDRGRYTARFEWLKLLELPEGFDLLNFGKISEDALKGETEINGIPVTLTLLFPAPIGNCHWHVWWSD